jgi:hypothetical protein
MMVAGTFSFAVTARIGRCIAIRGIRVSRKRKVLLRVRLALAELNGGTILAFRDQTHSDDDRDEL